MLTSIKPQIAREVLHDTKGALYDVWVREPHYYRRRLHRARPYFSIHATIHDGIRKIRKDLKRGKSNAKTYIKRP